MEIKEWERMFDLIPHGGAISPNGDYVTVVSAKHFITELLSTQKRELREKIEGMKNKETELSDFGEGAIIAYRHVLNLLDESSY